MLDKKDCIVNADSENLNYQLIRAIYSLDTKEAFEEYIPEPNVKDVESYKWYKKIRDMLEEYIMSVSDSYVAMGHQIGHFYDARDKETGVSLRKDTLPYLIMRSIESQLHFRKSYPAKEALLLDKSAYISAYGWIKESINRKTSDWKLGIIKSNLMPTHYTLLFEDASEITSSAAEYASITDQRAIQRRMPYEEELVDLNKKLISYLQAGPKRFDLNDYIIGEVSGFYLNETKKENEISILKVNYSNKNKNEIINFTVKDKNGKVFNIIDKDFSIKKGIERMKWITDSLIEKSVMYFKDDLMIGQTGYFVPSSTPTKEDLDEIDWLIKADNKKQTLEKERAAKIGDKEKHTGSPYIKYKDVKIGDKVIRLQYVIVKQGEDKVGEQYNLYLVKHKVIEPKTLSTEERKTVNYYSYDEKSGKFTPNISNKNKQYDVNKLTQEAVLSTGETSNKLVFEKGFYSASKQLPYGEVLNRHFNPIPGSSNLKGFTGYERLAKQPNENIMNGGKFGYGIWDSLYDQRKLYKKLYGYESNRINKTSVRHNELAKLIKDDYDATKEIRKEEILTINKFAIEIISKRIVELNKQKESKFKTSTQKKTIITELAKLHDKKNKLKESLTKDVKDEILTNRKAMIQALKDLDRFGIRNNLWVEGEEENTSVKSYSEEHTMIGENYASVGYIKQVREDAANEEINRINIEIDRLTKKKDKEKNVTIIKNIDKLIEKHSLETEHFENLGDYFRKDNDRQTLLNLSTTPHNVKHRLPFMDETKRDKSTSSQIKRLHLLFSRMERNETTINTLEAIHNLSQFRNSKGQLPINQINSMMNEVRMALGDNTVKSDLFGIPTDYESVAKFLNNIPGFSRWTPEGAERLATQLKGFATQWFLRSMSSIPNRGQSYLPTILFGYEINSDAREALYGDTENVLGCTKEEWHDFADFGGANNASWAFIDATKAVGSRLGMRDGGSYMVPQIFRLIPVIGKLLPGTVPNMPAFTDYAIISFASREKFVESIQKSSEFKSAIANFPPLKAITKRFTLEGIIQKRLKKITSEEQEKHLLRASNALYTIYTMPKNEKTRENVNKVLRDSLIDYKDSLMRQWVNWTITWYFDKDLQDLKYITTFGGTEEYNHKISYIASIIAADRLGSLGDVGGKTRFKSTEAVNIGRIAMELQQFQINAPNLGKAFWNFGGIFMQFKNFMLFRTVFGHNIMKNFRLGSQGNYFDMTKRLIKASLYLASNKKSYYYGKPGVDTEAIQATRLVYMSGIASMVSISIANFRLLSYTLKKVSPGFNNFISGQRGMESPPVSLLGTILVRYLVAIALYGTGSDDDEEKRRKKTLKATIRDILRLLGAPVMSPPVQYMLDLYLEHKDSQD